MREQQFEEGFNYAKKIFLEDKSSHLWLDKRVIRKKLDLTNKRILDFGCGLGGMTLWYAKNWDCSVHGIDIDSNHLKIANALKYEYSVPNVVFEEKNVLEIKSENVYDVIFLNDVIEHIPLPLLDKILQKLAKLLSINGIIYISINMGGVRPTPGRKRDVNNTVN